MKRKRAKPFNATGRAVKDLESDNWTVGIVEQRIPWKALSGSLEKLERLARYYDLAE
jgi:hypothetical protein